MTRYSIRVAWSEADTMFVAVCPELGEVSALGHTQQQAVAELEQAVESALETYRSKKWPIPNPAVVDEHSGQFRLRVPKSLHAWLSHEAARQHMSLNAMVVALLSQSRGWSEGQAAAADRITSALEDLESSLRATVRSTIAGVVSRKPEMRPARRRATKAR